MKNKIFLFIAVILYFMGCDAAEELFKERQAPDIVSIESDKGLSVNPGDTLTITVSATNPEDGDLTYKWLVPAGNIIDGNFSSSLTWKVPLIGGSYLVEIEVSNDYKSSKENITIEVISNLNPYVKINAPINGEYLVQHSTYNIQFDASHNNGIAQIYMYINDQVIDSLVGISSTSSYNRDWEITQVAGDTELKIEAISRLTAKSGFDSVNFSIEGILPGKTNE